MDLPKFYFLRKARFSRKPNRLDQYEKMRTTEPIRKQYLKLMAILMLSITSCKAQTVELTTYSVDYFAKNKIPKSGSYIKDNFGYLDQYLGTWETTLSDRRIELYISPGIKTSPSGVKRDVVLVRYKIDQLNGTSDLLLEDTSQLPDDSYRVLYGFYPYSNGIYKLGYQGEFVDCGQSGYMYFEPVATNNGDLKVWVNAYTPVIYKELCPEGYKAPPFPSSKVTFTKKL